VSDDSAPAGAAASWLAMTRPSLLAKLPEEPRREVTLLLTMAVGTCPYCGPDAGGAVVYRSSTRSVTMRCRDCGLQWTMTIHLLARAAQQWAEEAKGSPVEGHTAALARYLAGWADALGERRGRRRASPQTD